MFPIYLELWMCSLTTNTTRETVYTMSCTWNQFSYSCFMIFGVLFGFGFCVLLLFFCRLAWNIHWIYSTLSYTENKKSKGNTFYTFSCYNNLLLTRLGGARRSRNRTTNEHVKTSHDVYEVQCCVNFKSHFFSWYFYDSDVKLDIISFVSLLEWTNRNEDRHQFNRDRELVTSLVEKIVQFDKRFLLWINQTLTEKIQ